MGQKFHNIVVLTGAGVSAESGIKTFRDAGGLWEGHRVEDVATPEGFERDPDLVYDFYNRRRQKLQSGAIVPNLAHRALADLERATRGEFLLVTQNIDNLHERAGSRRIIHMHGELLKARCVRSERALPWDRDIKKEDRCQCCKTPSPLRPHVVWFGEMPLEMEAIYESLRRTDLFLAIGTSGVVYPAAGFVQEARAAGAHAIELNLEPSHAAPFFHEHIGGPATQTVPALVNRLVNTP